MKKNDKIAYHQKTAAELNKILSEVSKKLAENKVKYQMGSLKDSSVFKKLKYEIALIKTLLATK